MSAGRDQDIAAAWRTDALAARVARAGERAEAALTGAIADLQLSDDARLDDRTRMTLALTMGGVVDRIAAGIRCHAGRLLADRDRPELGERVLTRPANLVEQLRRGGALSDPALLAEMIARVRLDILQDSLPLAATESDEPSLMVRLAGAPDRVVASAGAALLAAENRRRDQDGGQGFQIDLPAALHRHLAWSVAAAIGRAGEDHAIDQAVVEATQRTLDEHDEDDRVDALAMRLAKAIEPRRAELPALLVDALADQRLRLFVALIAHALALPLVQARAITLERGGDRLWLALRVLDLNRATVARIAFALAEADPARDIDAFADQLDAIAAVTPAEARAALASVWLHADYRAAVLTQAAAR